MEAAKAVITHHVKRGMKKKETTRRTSTIEWEDLLVLVACLGDVFFSYTREETAVGGGGGCASDEKP